MLTGAEEEQSGFGNRSRIGSGLHNPRRRAAYAINGAIPVLLPDEAREVSEAERTQFTAAGAYVVTGAK